MIMIDSCGSVHGISANSDVFTCVSLCSGGTFMCPHQTRTSCTWREVDGENSFQSDMGYYVSVLVKDNRTRAEYQTSSLFIDTEAIGERKTLHSLCARAIMIVCSCWNCTKGRCLLKAQSSNCSWKIWYYGNAASHLTANGIGFSGSISP